MENLSLLMSRSLHLHHQLLIVSDYINLYDGGYFLVQASDPDSGDHQFSEVVAVDDDNDGFITEFAVLETNQNLGTVGIAKTNDITKITFEPVADRNIQVKVFSHLVRPSNDSGTDISLDFNNSSVNSFQERMKELFQILRETSH